MKVEGDYNLEDYRAYKVIEDNRTNLVYDPKSNKLVPKQLEEFSIDPGQTLERPKKLVEELRNTNLWNRILEDGEKTLKLNIAVTLLMTTITTTKNNEAFIEGIKKYFAGLKDSSKAYEFSKEEKALLQSLINKSEFKVNLAEIL